MLKKYLLILVIGMNSSPVLSGQWTGEYVITDLVLEGTESQPIVNVSLNPTPQEACSDNSFATMRTDSERGKQALSVLMTASAANKKVRLYFDGCLGARPNLTLVWLIN